MTKIKMKLLLSEFLSVHFFFNLEILRSPPSVCLSVHTHMSTHYGQFKCFKWDLFYRHLVLGVYVAKYLCVANIQPH